MSPAPSPHGENTQSTNQSVSNRPLNPCTSTMPPTRNTTNNIRRVPRAYPFCHYRSRPHKTQTKHPKPRDPLHVGHSVVHASDACGSRERPTGRALPQAEQLETPQQLGKDADVAPAASEVRERGPRATERRAAAGRGVATPRRRAKVHRTPPGAQNRAVRSRSEKSSPQRLVARIEKPLWRWKMPFSVTHPFCCVARRVPHGGLSGWANLIGWLTRESGVDFPALSHVSARFFPEFPGLFSFFRWRTRTMAGVWSVGCEEGEPDVARHRRDLDRFLEHTYDSDHDDNALFSCKQRFVAQPSTAAQIRAWIDSPPDPEVVTTPGGFYVESAPVVAERTIRTLYDDVTSDEQARDLTGSYVRCTSEVEQATRRPRTRAPTTGLVVSHWLPARRYAAPHSSVRTLLGAPSRFMKRSWST